MSSILVDKAKQTVKTYPWDLLLIVILGIIGFWVGLWASVIIMDDAMITFRVAENLAFGRGFVFNVGERVQVTTTPLYSMVLVPGIWLFGSAPRAALLLNLTLSALIPVLAYDLGRRLAGRITGVGGALLIVASPFMVMAFSMESYLYAAMILASMDAYVSRHYRLAGVLVGITSLVRGDGALLGACMLVYDALTRRRLYWRLIIPAVAIPAAWYLFALIYYGSPFPATLGAKVAQGEFNWLRINFIEGLIRYLWEWTDEGDKVIYYLFPVLFVVGLIRVLWAERPWLILIGRDVLYLTAFTALNVPQAEWYYAPLMPGFALLTARGIQVIAERVATIVAVNDRKRDLISAGVAAIFTVTLLWLMYPVTNGIVQQHPDWKARAYPGTARWIARNTGVTASLATIDIGHLGYWSNRRIIDIVGLAQPDVASHIATGDFGYAIREYQPDLVLVGYLWLKEVQSADWFKENYAARQYFKPAGMDQPLLLFSRRAGVKVQTDTIPATEIEPLDLDFNRQITLTGYHLDQSLKVGDNLSLTLFWQVQAPIEVDFTVFVQLVDADSNIVAQGDSKPQDGFYTTPYWQPGEQVIDTHTFSIPADLSPGKYDLLLGLYEAETGHRLQILDEAGAFENDHVRLSNIKLRAPELQ